MKILAFDTTNATLSVAILCDEKKKNNAPPSFADANSLSLKMADRHFSNAPSPINRGIVIAQKNILEENQHSTMLIPSIEECLGVAKIWYQDLDLIAFTNGPGSFTGIRVGYSCAKALRIATKLPVIAVNSLEAIAYGYLEKSKECKKILIASDARLEEFFIQEFLIENNSLKTISEPLMIRGDAIQDFLPQEKFILAGSAKNMIGGDLQNAVIFPDHDFIDAKNIALLAQNIYQEQDLQDFSDALYIRKPKISERKKS